MQTITGYQCETSVGIFRIELQDDGKFHIIHDNRQVGPYTYSSAEAALRDLVSGNLTLPSSGVSAAMLGIPDSLREWGVVMGGGDVNEYHYAYKNWRGEK